MNQTRSQSSPRTDTEQFLVIQLTDLIRIIGTRRAGSLAIAESGRRTCRIQTIVLAVGLGIVRFLEAHDLVDIALIEESGPRILRAAPGKGRR